MFPVSEFQRKTISFGLLSFPLIDNSGDCTGFNKQFIFLNIEIINKDFPDAENLNVFVNILSYLLINSVRLFISTRDGYINFTGRCFKNILLNFLKQIHATVTLSFKRFEKNKFNGFLCKWFCEQVYLHIIDSALIYYFN